MKDPQKNVVWAVILFSVTMAMFEAAVVVYLRALYYPDGFQFPLVLISDTVGITELLREFASLVMIVSVAWLAGKHFTTRFAWFLIIFAIWDIFYYVFLKLILNWPESLLTWDILFLIPVSWTGPVITPVFISFIMIALGWAILYYDKKLPGNVRITRLEWWTLIAGAFVVFVSFIWDFSSYLLRAYFGEPLVEMSFRERINYISTTYLPGQFNWFIFTIGVTILLISIYMFVKRNTIETSAPKA